MTVRSIDVNLIYEFTKIYSFKFQKNSWVTADRLNSKVFRIDKTRSIKSLQ